MHAVTTSDIADKPGLRKPEAKRRALERNRRSNFARTAKTTLTAYAKAGCSVAAVVVPTVTKGSLRIETAKHKPAITKSTDDQADAVVTHVMRIMSRVAAENVAKLASQKLILQLTDMACDKYTTSPQKAQTDFIPLRAGGSLFLPLPSPPPAEH